LSAPAREERAVHCKIEREDDRSEHQLYATGESGRIQNRQQIMLDESAAVTGFPSARSECVLERCKRTHPARELDHHSPNRRGQMQPGQTRAPQNEQPTENDEPDECEVNYDDEISERAVRDLSAQVDL